MKGVVFLVLLVTVCLAAQRNKRHESTGDVWHHGEEYDGDEHEPSVETCPGGWSTGKNGGVCYRDFGNLGNMSRLQAFSVCGLQGDTRVCTLTDFAEDIHFDQLLQQEYHTSTCIDDDSRIPTHLDDCVSTEYSVTISLEPGRRGLKTGGALGLRERGDTLRAPEEKRHPHFYSGAHTVCCINLDHGHEHEHPHLQNQHFGLRSEPEPEAESEEVVETEDEKRHFAGCPVDWNEGIPSAYRHHICWAASQDLYESYSDAEVDRFEADVSCEGLYPGSHLCTWDEYVHDVDWTRDDVLLPGRWYWSAGTEAPGLVFCDNCIALDCSISRCRRSSDVEVPLAAFAYEYPLDYLHSWDEIASQVEIEEFFVCCMDLDYFGHL